MANLRKFYSKIPFLRLMVHKSKSLVLPGMEGISFYEVMVVFLNEMYKDRLDERAASISFNFLLALPPTFIFLFTLIPYIPLQTIEPTIFGMIHDLTPNYKTYLIIKNVISDFLHTQRNGLLSFAFLLGFFYSSNGVLGIMQAFDKIHPSFKRRNIFQSRWVAIKITSLLIFLVIVSILLIIVQNATFSYLFYLLGIQSPFIITCIGIVRWIIIILLFFSIISFIYTYGPSMKKRWKFITAGSTLATFLIIMTSLAFSYYVTHFSSYNKIYGSIGSVMILMLWIYFNSYVLLIGFELNTSILTIKESRHEETNYEIGS
ncbi:MAG: YihY/virulence factor BrkB family protein [Chitinophagaceae bacterium]